MQIWLQIIWANTISSSLPPCQRSQGKLIWYYDPILQSPDENPHYLVKWLVFFPRHSRGIPTQSSSVSSNVWAVEIAIPSLFWDEWMAIMFRDHPRRRSPKPKPQKNLQTKIPTLWIPDVVFLSNTGTFTEIQVLWLLFTVISPWLSRFPPPLWKLDL